MHTKIRNLFPDILSFPKAIQNNSALQNPIKKVPNCVTAITETVNNLSLCS